MKIAFFSAHRFERSIFDCENTKLEHPHAITYFDANLNEQNVPLAKGYEAVSIFVSDSVPRQAVQELAANGTKIMALRSAGYNHVDLDACREFGVGAYRVPAYSPHAIAEHALALLLTLNRKIHRAFNRVRELNFSIDGLVGFDLFGKTIGVVGTGKIGACFARAMRGLGCNVLAHDVVRDKDLEHEGVRYVELNELLSASHIISLHAPLLPSTHHLLNRETLALTRKGVIIVNTSRGGLIDAAALIEGLKSGHIGGAALDVYEEEEGVFFRDLSENMISDDILARLLTFPNVLITAHQAFLTEEALHNIAETTLKNVTDFEQKGPSENRLV